MGDPEDLPMPAPLVITDEPMESMYGDLSDPFNPRAVALAWVASIVSRDREAFEMLVADPSEWDLDEVAAMTDGYGLSSHVDESEDPDLLVNMRLVAGVGDQPVVVAGPMLVEALNIALVGTDTGWRVWRLGGEQPGVDDVFAT